MRGWMDRFAARSMSFCGVQAPPYLVLGVAGVASAFVAFTVSCIARGFPLSTAFSVGVLALAGFTLAGIVRQRLGRAPHILLEDVTLVLAITAVLAWALALSVLAALDHVIIALGVFLVFGRLGCLASGCCHGRPASVGVEYPHGSIADALVGIRLFPVQLVEAVWICVVTVIAVPFAGSGDAFELWVIGYSTGRFVLEWLRGDTDRPTLGPLSEAQWIGSLAILATFVLDGWKRSAPPSLLVAAIFAALVAAVGWGTRRWWFAPPPPAIDVSAIARWLRVLADVEAAARHSPQHHASCQIDSAVGTIDVSVEIDLSDRGSAIAAYAITGGDELSTLQLVAGLIVQRRPDAHVLRASASGAGYLLWVHDHAPTAADVVAHPLHTLFRALAIARALAERPAEPPPVARQRSATAYLQPWRPS